MTNTPTAVTERYVSNLLKRGTNNDFRICTIYRQIAIEDGCCVGVYYQVMLASTTQSPESDKIRGVGLTPASALRRALEKFGVTFR